MTRPKFTSVMFRSACAVLGLSLIAAGLGVAVCGCGMSLESAPGDSRGGGFFGAGNNFGGPPAPQADAPAGLGLGESGGDTAEALREIEEADVLKIVDGRAYVLNSYKGLIIIDVSNPDAPSILGRLSFAGRPVEMYVVGERAYVITSSDVYYSPPYYDVGVANGALREYSPPAFTGSKVAVIDVSDAANPASMGDVLLVGYATASRRVGDVIYVVGTDVPYLSTSGGGDGGSGGAGMEVPPPNADAIAPYPYYTDQAFCASINVADPANIVPVERVTFDGSATALHVSTEALFATSSQYDPDASESQTRVQYVDISDPAGDIQVRGSVNVPGTIRNRFYLDDFDGALRILTESFGFGFQQVRCFTYDLSDPDAIQPLGSVSVIQGESLEAARFDGPRGYAVTFLRKDPLFLLDLSDPANPTVTGQLEVPGYSTHIEPRGDRLIAVGIDDTDGQRPAVVLYDVSDPAAPVQRSRIVLGPPSSFAESAATYDEKAFKIVEELGLIAIPFSYYDSSKIPQPLPMEPVPDDVAPAEGDAASDAEEPAPSADDFLTVAELSPCVNAVQLIDYTGDALVQRGWFTHVGRVERVGVIGERAFAMSQLAFQVVNIDDRDQPESAALVPFIDGAELPYFDGCGYYYPYYDDVPFIPLLTLLSRLFGYLEATGSSDGTCGAIAPMPVLFMAAGFGGLTRLMRTSRRRRR